MHQYHLSRIALHFKLVSFEIRILSVIEYRYKLAYLRLEIIYPMLVVHFAFLTCVRPILRWGYCDCILEKSGWGRCCRRPSKYSPDALLMQDLSHLWLEWSWASMWRSSYQKAKRTLLYVASVKLVRGSLISIVSVEYDMCDDSSWDIINLPSFLTSHYISRTSDCWQSRVSHSSKSQRVLAERPAVPVCAKCSQA